jgi:TP901 family phage tail tape measure protein
MATNYSQLIEVVVALKDESGQAAQQLQTSINKIVEAIDKLSAASAKKSLDPITSALKGLKQFSDPAKNQIESLTTSFNNLTSSIKSTKDALTGLKVPQGVLNALQTISTPPAAVAAATTTSRRTKKAVAQEVTPAELDAQAQAAAALAAQQVALTATDEAATKADAEQGKTAEKVTAQMRAQEAAIASARTNLMTWKAAIEQITTSLNKHIEAVRAQGSTNAEISSSAQYARTALTELNRIINSAESALRKFTGESYSSNAGAKALAQELAALAAALKAVYKESSGKLIVGQELSHQQMLVKRASTALDEYHSKIAAASRILKEKGIEGISTNRAEKLLDGIREAGQKVVRTFKDVSENVDIRPKGFNQLFSAAEHLNTYVANKLGPALNKAIDISPSVTSARNDLRTLETSLVQASSRFKEIQQKIFKPGSTAALQPGLTTGDLKEYEIALRGVLQNIDKHFRKVASTSNPFAKNTEDAKLYEQQINAINAAYGRLSVSLRNAQKSVTKQIGNLGEYGDAWVGINKNTGLQINSLGDLTGSAATIGKKLTQGLTNFAARTGGSVESVQRVTEAVTDLETQMIRFRSGVVTWSIGLLMMSSAIAVPFKAAIDILTQLSDNLAQAGAITGATAEEFTKLEKAAFDMGRTTRFTSLQASEALVQLGRNGFNATESMALLPTALQLAQAAAINFGLATDIVTNIMTAFNMSVEDFPRAADVLTKAFTSSNATLENLGFGFTYVGSLAKGLGADFDDLIGALAKLHDAGFKGTMAGTALRGALDGLFNPTKQEAEVMKDLSAQLGLVGFTIKDVEGNFVGWVEIIRQLENASFSSEQALKLFGQRAGPGVAALLQIGSKELENYLGTLKNSEGITKRLSDVMENTLKGKFLELTSAIEGLGENFARSVEPALKLLASAGADIINTFTDIRMALGPITVVFDNLLGILVPLAVALGSLTFAWFVMIVPVKQLTNALTLLFGAAKSAQATLLGIPEGMNASAGELAKLNAARTKAVSLARQIGIIEAEQAVGNQKNVSQLTKLNTELAKSEAAYRAITLKILESNAASAEALAIEQARLQGLNAATAATAGAAARIQATTVPSVFRTGLIDKKTNVPLDFDVELGYARGSTQEQIDAFRKNLEKRASIPISIPLDVKIPRGLNPDIDKFWSLNTAAIRKSAAEEGAKVGNTFGKSIAAGFKNFMSGGFASSIALLVSSFTSVFGSNFLLAVVAIEQLVGANIKWKDSIVKVGAALASFFRTLTYFKGLGLILGAITALTIAYQYFKSTTQEVIKSLTDEGDKLVGLKSELQNVKDNYEQLTEKKKQFEESGKLGDPGVIASLNRELIAASMQLNDVYKGFIKLGAFTGKEIFYTVKTEIIDGKKVESLVAVFKDGTEVVQGFDTVVNGTFTNIADNLKAIDSLGNVAERAITQNNINLVNEYLDVISSTNAELARLKYAQKRATGTEEYGDFNKAYQEQVSFFDKLALLRVKFRAKTSLTPEELNSGILKTFGRLSEEQRQLAQLRVFQTRDLEAQKLWIDKIADGDKKRAEILYQQLETGKAYNRLLEQQIKLNRANRLGPQLGSLASSLDEVLKEGYEGLGKLGDILSNSFEFNTEGLDKKLESLNSTLEQTKGQLQAQYDNERDNLNKTFELLYTYGQERQDLYDRLTSSGYKYALEDFKYVVNFEFKKAQAVRASIAERDALFSQYYADQQKYLTAVDQDYQGLGKYIPEEISKYLNLRGATEDYASLNQEAAKLTENINQSTNSTKDLSSTTEKYTEDYKKAILLRNALDTKAAEHVKKTLEEQIKVEEDIQKTLFDVRKRFSDKFLELEKNRVKVQKELEQELIALKNFKSPKKDTGIFKDDIKEFQKITKEQYDLLSKEEQRTYRNEAIDQQYKSYKERIKLTEEYKGKIIELGYELRKAYAIQDVEGFDNIKDKIVDLVKNAKDAAKDGKLNVKDLGLDLLLSNTKNLSNALKSELGGDYKKAGQTIQEALTASIKKTEELRNSLARVERALLTAFGEKGILQGFVTSLGEVSAKVKEAADNIKGLADTLKILQNARVEIEVVVKQGKEVSALTQSQEQLKRFSNIYNELTQNVNAYVNASAEDKGKLGEKVAANLKELSNIAPNLEKMLPSLAAIEGMDSTAIGELGAALSGFGDVSVEQFNRAREAAKDSEDATRNLLLTYNQLGTNVVNAGNALATNINNILPALKKTYEDNAVAIKDVLNKVIPDALRSLNDQIGSIKSLTINVDQATANLGIVRASLQELIKLKQELEGKSTAAPAAPAAPAASAAAPAASAAAPKIVQAQVVATYKPGSSPEELVNKSQQQVKPIEIPVEFQGVKEYEEWYTEYVQQFKELPDLSLASKYDYKKALAAGVKPSRVEDGTYHWPSKTPSGEWLKLEGHQTRWKEELIEASQKAGDALQTNVGGTLTDIKTKLEEKLSLVFDVKQAIAALDVVIAKLKEIVEQIKNIGKTPVQISQQGQAQQGQVQQGQVQQERVIIPAQVVVEPAQLQQTVDTAASKLQPIKSKGLATLRDGSILQDDKQLYEEFNRQQAKAGNRQLDLDKIPTQIRAAGKSLYEIVNLYNDELERTGELFRIEPPIIDYGQSYDQLAKEFEDRNIRNTKGFKIPVEYEFKDLVKPTFDWRDYRVPIAAEWKFSPEDLIAEQQIKDIKVPLLPTWEVFPEQLTEQDYFKQFFEEQEVKIKPTFEEDYFKQFFEEQEVKIKPTFEEDYFKQFFEEQEVKIKPTFEQDYFKQFFEDNKQVSISLQPESEEKVLSGIEKIRQKAATSPLTLFFKPEIPKDQKPEQLIPKEFFDTAKQLYNDFSQEVSKINLFPNLELAFNQSVLKNKLDGMVQSYQQTASEIAKIEEEIKVRHKALFEQDDQTQAPFIDSLTSQLATLTSQLATYEAKIKELSQSITEHVLIPPVAPENANPLGSIIAAVTAGKDAILTSLTSITTSISAQFTPVLTQLRIAMNLGVMQLDVSGAIAGVNQLIAALIQAINLKNQLASGNVSDTGGETPIASNATGGYITGPGTSVSDSILSWLSNGEYVVDAFTTKFFSPGFFKSLKEYARKGVMPSFKLPKFASGGLAGVTSNMDYNVFSGSSAKLAVVSPGVSGTPVVLNIYDKTFQLSAKNDVAEQLRKVLSIENLKRGRK